MRGAKPGRPEPRTAHAPPPRRNWRPRLRAPATSPHAPRLAYDPANAPPPWRGRPADHPSSWPLPLLLPKAPSSPPTRSLPPWPCHAQACRRLRPALDSHPHPTCRPQPPGRPSPLCRGGPLRRAKKIAGERRDASRRSCAAGAAGTAARRPVAQRGRAGAARDGRAGSGRDRSHSSSRAGLGHPPSAAPHGHARSPPFHGRAPAPLRHGPPASPQQRQARQGGVGRSG